MKITDISLKHRVAVTVLTVSAAVLGWFGLTQLDVDYLPEITYPMVKVHIWWRGATPEEIETNIAEPIEQAMATVDHLDYLDSSSIEGMYTLLVNFRYGTDVDVAYQDVMAIMGRVNPQLPPDMDPPMVMKADPSQLPVLEVTLASDRRSLVWLRDWAENWLVERLSTVQGTAGAEVVGGLKREIRVHLDPRTPERLRHLPGPRGRGASRRQPPDLRRPGHGPDARDHRSHNGRVREPRRNPRYRDPPGKGRCSGLCPGCRHG